MSIYNNKICISAFGGGGSFVNHRVEYITFRLYSATIFLLNYEMLLAWEELVYLIRYVYTGFGNTVDGSTWWSTIDCPLLAENWYICIRPRATNSGAPFSRKRTRNFTAPTRRWRAARRARPWKTSLVELRKCTKWTKHRRTCSIYC